MPAPRKSKLISAALSAILAVLVYPYAENEWRRWRWLQKFETKMTENGFVALGSLVNFEWDKVYILRSYDLSMMPLRLEIGRGREFSNRWTGDERYVVVVYRRVKGYPFAVGLYAGDWVLARNSLLLSNTKNARVEQVELGSPSCPKEWARAAGARCFRMLQNEK